MLTNSKHMKPVSTFVLFLLIIPSLGLFAQTNMLCQELYPGIWKATAGKPEKISLLSAAGAIPQLQALAKLPKTSFPLDKAAIEIGRAHV